MDKIEKIRKKINELQDEFISIQPKDCSLKLIKSYAGYRYLDKVLSFIDTLEEEPGKSLEEAAEEFAEGEWDGLHDDDGNALYTQDYIEYTFKAGAKWLAEQFAEIIRANLSEIGDNAQSQFEQLYFEITGTKMYGEYND